MTIFLKNLMKWVKNSVIRFMFSEMENTQKVLCLWMEKTSTLWQSTNCLRVVKFSFGLFVLTYDFPLTLLILGKFFYIFTQIRQNLHFFVAILFLLC